MLFRSSLGLWEDLLRSCEIKTTIFEINNSLRTNFCATSQNNPQKVSWSHLQTCRSLKSKTRPEIYLFQGRGNAFGNSFGCDCAYGKLTPRILRNIESALKTEATDSGSEVRLTIKNINKANEAAEIFGFMTNILSPAS